MYNEKNVYKSLKIFENRFHLVCVMRANLFIYFIVAIGNHARLTVIIYFSLFGIYGMVAMDKILLYNTCGRNKITLLNRFFTQSSIDVVLILYLIFFIS